MSAFRVPPSCITIPTKTEACVKGSRQAAQVRLRKSHSGRKGKAGVEPSRLLVSRGYIEMMEKKMEVTSFWAFLAVCFCFVVSGLFQLHGVESLDKIYRIF